MPESVLDALRAKYPQYKDVPDDTLTLAVGKKFPQYLSNKDFAADFGKLSKAPVAPATGSSNGAGLPRWAQPPPVAGPQITGPIKVAPHQWTPQEMAGQTSPPESKPGLITELPKAVVADVAAGLDMAAARQDKVQDAEAFSGNIPAALAGKPLPIDQIIKSMSGDPDNATAATLAKTSMGIASTAPMVAIGGLPGAVQKVILAAFTLDMARNIPKTSQALGDEFAKPKDQRDYGKITDLLSDGIQQLLFSAAGAKHIEGAGREAVAKAMVDKYVPRGHGIDSAPWRQFRLKPATESEVQNASSQQKTATVHGDVQSQPVKSQGQVPVEKVGGGVQPQAQPVAKETQVPLSEQMRQDAAQRYGKKWPKDVRDDIAAQERKEKSQPVEHPAATTADVLDPEHQKMLDVERGNVDVPVNVVNDKEMKELEEGGDPFAKNLQDQLHQSVATIDRSKNRIVINPRELSEWLQRIPANQRQHALRSLIGEERIHLATDDAAATAYWKNLTGLEQAIVKRRYGDFKGMNDTLWGHEALRFRMQQLARMTPREIAESVGREKWTLKALTLIESAIRGVRDTLGSKATREQKAILDRIQKNLDLGKTVAGGATPGAIDKETQERAEKEASDLESQAQMYVESGDAESANELKAMAAKLRGQTGEQYFPGARPKEEEAAPGERLVTVRRPDGSTYTASFGGKYWDFTAQGRGRVPSIAVQKEGKWSHGTLPPGHQIVEENFPAARPKKRHESVFQDKFILPGMETKWDPDKGIIAPLKLASQSESVPTEQRTSAEAAGALPRLTEEEIHSRAASWVGNALNEALAASDKGKRATLPDFDDFAAYMKKQAPHYQGGRLFDLWRDYMAKTFEDMPGDALQRLGKGAFAPQTSLKRVENISKTSKDIQPLFQKPRYILAAEQEREALQPGKEAGATIWNRPVPDKPGPDSVINAFRDREKRVHQLEEQARTLEGTEGQGFEDIMERLNDARKDVVKLKKPYAEAMQAQSWRNKVISSLYRKTVKPALEGSDARLDRKSISPEDLRYGAPHAYEDISKAPTDTVAIRNMIAEGSRRSRDDSAAVTKRVLVLLNPRSGTVHIVSAYEHPGLTQEITNQGKTDVKDIRVLDPISPTKESVPLKSITNRYKLLYTGLLDEPVRKFRQDFSGLSDYNEVFGKEAAERQQQHESYDPLQVSEAEFMEAGGGRIERGEGGSFQGPHKSEVLGETGTGELEKGEKTPLTDSEASSIFDFVIGEVGRLDSASDVEDALTPEALSKNRQAMSGIAKLGRQVGDEYPFATGEEVKGKLAERIYMAHKEATSLNDFQKKLGVYQKIKVPPEAPSKTGREIETARSRSVTTTSDKLPPQFKPGKFKGSRPKPQRAGKYTEPKRFTGVGNEPTEVEKYNFLKGVTAHPKESPGWFPMARRKAPTEEKSIARITWDSLFQLYNNRAADVRDAFPKLQEMEKMLSGLPSNSPKKVSDKLDEEIVLGKSDIVLTPNEQKLYDIMADLWAQAKQKEAHLKGKDPDAKTEYWPRMLADPNSLFERIIRGVKKYSTEGTVVSGGGWFTKSRKIKALQDEKGNRRVVVIVGKGDEGKLVAYDKGQSTDMGPYHWKDVARRGDRLHKELEPINKEADQVMHDINMLQRTQERQAASKVLLRKRHDRLAELFEEADNIAAKYPDDTLDRKTWMDKDGKEWRVTEATGREIESNMRTRFYHNAYPLLLALNLKLDQNIRQMQWMEDFKESPEFQQIASVGDQPGRPTDWRLSELPQMRGIYFHPRLADVFDQFHEQNKRGDYNAIRNINRALQGALFWNQPFLHDPNLLTWWFAARGASAWLNPRAYPRMYRSFSRAFHDVLSKNSDYTNYLRLGTPLQLERTYDFGQRLSRMLTDQLESNPPLAKRISNILGYANPAKLLSTVGRAATEGLHDILTLQLIHEGEERGIPPHEMLRRVTAIMPDRRIPPRVLGQRWLSKLMADGNIMWFAAYHYAEGKAFLNLLKGAAGKSGNMSREEAIDKIAAIGLLMFAAYPALDALIKEVTGKNYALRRAGPTTWPTAIADVAAGRKTPSMITPSFISLSPLFTAVPSLLANRNLMNRGLPIYNPRAPIAQQAAAISAFAGQTINPIQMYGDLIKGRTTWDDIALNLVGIRRDYGSQPHNKIYGWAYDWAKETGNQKLLNRFNEEANEVYPESVYNPLKEALGDGNDARARKAIARLHADGKTDAEIERALRPSSHPLSGLEQYESQFQDSLSASQRQVYDEEKSRRDEVYQKFLELAQ